MIKIGELNGKTAKVIGKIVRQAVKDALAKDFEDVKLGNAPGTFYPDEGLFKIRLELAIDKEAVDSDRSTEAIQFGFCKRGERVMTLNGRVVIIDKAMRTNYAFHYEDEPDRPMKGNFKMFMSIKENGNA